MLFYSTENCIDRNDNCAVWAKYRQCTENPGYMLEFCPRSCGQCAGSAIMESKYIKFLYYRLRVGNRYFFLIKEKEYLNSFYLIFVIYPKRILWPNPPSDFFGFCFVLYNTLGSPLRTKTSLMYFRYTLQSWRYCVL